MATITKGDLSLDLGFVKLGAELSDEDRQSAWELYTDPGMLAAFSYGYLADAPGPRVMTKEGFDHDGISFRVTEDFYAGAVALTP